VEFCSGNDLITKYFNPHQGSARNLEARNKAIESILNKIQLCKALKIGEERHSNLPSEKRRTWHLTLRLAG
jgi:hypothetical protein